MSWISRLFRRTTWSPIWSVQNARVMQFEVGLHRNPTHDRKHAELEKEYRLSRTEMIVVGMFMRVIEEQNKGLLDAARDKLVPQFHAGKLRIVRKGPDWVIEGKNESD